MYTFIKKAVADEIDVPPPTVAIIFLIQKATTRYLVHFCPPFKCGLPAKSPSLLCPTLQCFGSPSHSHLSAIYILNPLRSSVCSVYKWFIYHQRIKTWKNKWIFGMVIQIFSDFRYFRQHPKRCECQVYDHYMNTSLHVI